MSKLYASIDSDARKTQATSRGHKHLSAHVRGWDVGVVVYADIQSTDAAVFEIYATRGSNDPSTRFLVGTVRIADAGDGAPHFYPAATQNDDEGEGGITPEGQSLGHRYVMGNVNAYCPKCSQEQGVAVLDCDYDLDK